MGEGVIETGYVCNVLCDPIDYSLPGSSVHGILQARILEWVAISFSMGSSWPKDQTYISCIGKWILYHWATGGSRYMLQDDFYFQKINLYFPWWSESLSAMSDSLQPHGLHSLWNSPGQNTGVGSLFFPQGIFATQGLNPDLLHWRWILYHLSHQGSPRILEWVAYHVFRGSSWPRNQIGVSCIAGIFFTNWDFP